MKKKIFKKYYMDPDNGFIINELLINIGKSFNDFILTSFNNKIDKDKENKYKKISTIYLKKSRIIRFILITIKNEVKMIRNCLIINVMFIQNDTLWVYNTEKGKLTEDIKKVYGKNKFTF